MTVNTELLEKVMQHIDDHPEQHDQALWVDYCGTAACFAGWAALLSGMTAVQIDMTRDMHATGAALLGITELDALKLFYTGNSRDVLRLMVKDLVNGESLRYAPEYEDEVAS